MRSIWILLSSAGLGSLASMSTVTAVATATVATSTAGCGGCGEDEVATTLAPAQACLEVHAYEGWGCSAGSEWFAGTNNCSEQLVIARAGTTLETNLVVAPGETFTVDVDDTRPPTFELSLGATLVTLTVAW